METEEIAFSDEQLGALEKFKTCGFSVVQGGPGTGKSALIEEMLRLGGGKDKVIVITPTGVTAGNLSVSGEIDAHVLMKVLHDMELMKTFRGMTAIIDEGSMISTKLANILLNDMRFLRVVVLGDHHQLPCVEDLPLHNSLVQIKGLQVTHLTKNFRQFNPDCGLVRTLKELGTPGFEVPYEDETLIIVRCPTVEVAISKAAEAFKANPQAQMLAFTQRVKDALNQQTAATGNKRVVCTMNMYGPEGMIVANGTIGNINSTGDVVYKNLYVDKKQRHKKKKRVLGTGEVEREVVMLKGENGEEIPLDHNSDHMSRYEEARCMTVHKAQGSQFVEHGIVVISAWRGPVPLELLNTMLSRFRQGVTIYGTSDVIDAAFKGKYDDENVDWHFVDLMEGGTRGRELRIKRQKRASAQKHALEQQTGVNMGVKFVPERQKT